VANKDPHESPIVSEVETSSEELSFEVCVLSFDVSRLGIFSLPGVIPNNSDSVGISQAAKEKSKESVPIAANSFTSFFIVPPNFFYATFLI
jgi:hypothetical protein